MGWDTKVTGLPVGGYVINQESSKLNKPVLEAMKFDNSKYPTTPAEVGNNEFVFTEKEVDMYGIDKMNELNNSAKEAAHSSIDGLMAMNTLSQIPAMAGGGNIENQMLPSYENGGKVPGYQDGGVSDATATSAMDELLAQAMLAESAQGQSQYSMVDADRVDTEENELMNMIISMAIPGAGAAGTTKAVLNEFIENSIAKGVKLPKLASEIIKMQPAKGKQKVLDKIAGTMKSAPGRKVIQNPKRDLYDWKDYKVLKNTLQKPFDKIDLVNPGYMQRYTNKLVKVRDKLHQKQITGKPLKTSNVKLGDVVDAVYPRGFLNVDELKRIGNIIPKQYRESEIAELLKMSKGSPQKLGGYQTGGKIDFNKPFGMSILEGEQSEYADSLGSENKEALQEFLQKELLQSMITGENRPERIERSPMEDAFTSDPNPGFGITILDDLISRALEQHRFCEIPHKR